MEKRSDVRTEFDKMVNTIFEDIKCGLTYVAIETKRKMFGLDKFTIEPHVFIMLALMSGDNPGVSLIMFSQILDHVNKKYNDKGIPDDCTITTEDLIKTFGNDFDDLSFVEDEYYNSEYMKLWNSQKTAPDPSQPFASDNLVDYEEWWSRYIRKEK